VSGPAWLAELVAQWGEPNIALDGHRARSEWAWRVGDEVRYVVLDHPDRLPGVQRIAVSRWGPSADDVDAAELRLQRRAELTDREVRALLVLAGWLPEPIGTPESYRASTGDLAPARDEA
jgi:hypothetical protein